MFTRFLTTTLRAFCFSTALSLAAYGQQTLADLTDEELLRHEEDVLKFISSLERLIAKSKQAEKALWGQPRNFDRVSWHQKLTIQIQLTWDLLKHLQATELRIENSEKDIFFRALEEILMTLDKVVAILQNQKNVSEEEAALVRALFEISSNHLAELQFRAPEFISDFDKREDFFRQVLELEGLRKQLNSDFGLLRDPLSFPLSDLTTEKVHQMEKSIWTFVGVSLGVTALIEVIRQSFKLNKGKKWKEKAKERFRNTNCGSFLHKLSEKSKSLPIKKTARLSLIGLFALIGGYQGYQASLAKHEKERPLYEFNSEKRRLMQIEIFHKYFREDPSSILNSYWGYKDGFNQSAIQDIQRFRVSGAKEAVTKLLKRWGSLEEALQAHQKQLHRTQVEKANRAL